MVSRNEDVHKNYYSTMLGGKNMIYYWKHIYRLKYGNINKISDM